MNLFGYPRDIMGRLQMLEESMLTSRFNFRMVASKLPNHRTLDWGSL